MNKLTIEDVRDRLGGEIDERGRLVLPEPPSEKVPLEALEKVFEDARLAGQVLVLQHTILEQEPDGDGYRWARPVAPTVVFLQ